MNIRKRDGSWQVFEVSKIRRAIAAAMQECGVYVDVMPLVNMVCDRLQRAEGEIGVEGVQDTIEEVLMATGHPRVAKAFILYRAERARERASRGALNPDGLGQMIHVSKYARHVSGRRETWEETVRRVFDMHRRRFLEYTVDESGRITCTGEKESVDVRNQPHVTPESIARLERAVLEKRILPSMRSLQFGGAAIEASNARMYNCSFTLLNRWSAVWESLYLLLCGCGVGFNVCREHVEQLAPLRKMDRTKVRHHTVADTIEGWCDALAHGIKCALRGEYPEWDFSLIRPEGAALRTSGGRAPGHLGLRDMLYAVRDKLEKVGERRVRAIEIYDIMCHMGEAVMSGGVRRSAMICLFGVEDGEMYYSKAPGNFDPSGVNVQRMMCNNSVILDRSATIDDLTRVVATAQQGYGEPGFWMGERSGGCNPCGEVTFGGVGFDDRGFGFCNLVEVNVAGCTGEEEFLSRCADAGELCLIQSLYSDFVYLGESSKHNAELRQLGVSLTGIMDNPGIGLNEALLARGRQSVLTGADRVGVVYDRTRVTCVKPSGTASLLLGGVSSGIHAQPGRRYIRRIRVKEGDLLYRVIRETNPHMLETGGYLCWPVEVPDSAILESELTGVDQVRNIVTVRRGWIGTGEWGNNVSATVVLDIGEVDGVVREIWEHRAEIGGISFVPRALGQKYAHLPREVCDNPVTENHWRGLVEGWSEIDWSTVLESEDGTEHTGERACAGGVCEL